jgi:predicted nucleotidyltransferase
MGIEKIKNIPIEKALFSKVQRQILALFFNHTDESFYTNEIIRLIGSGSGAIQRELKRLTLSGLLTIQKVGNQKRYQANPSSPIFSELKNIITKTFGLADCLRDALKPISAQIHIGFIYGSIAKGEATSQSDIDLMLISDSLTYADVYSLFENIGTQLKRTVNPTIYSSAEWIQKSKEKNNFIMRVLEQSKIFLIGNVHELRTIS